MDLERVTYDIEDGESLSCDEDGEDNVENIVLCSFVNCKASSMKRSCAKRP